MPMRIEKINDKKWRVFVFLWRDPVTGRRKFHTQTINGTRKSAETYGRKIETQRDTGTYIEPSEQTMEQYLAYWLDNVAAIKVCRNTLFTYRRLVTRYMVPYIGNVP